jgi:hypothetical protein
MILSEKSATFRDHAFANLTAGPLAADRRPSRDAQSLNIRNVSVDASVQLQPRDFVLHQQLATFQCHDLKIIDRWVGPRFVNFRLEGPMTSFQFRKMGFYGHVVQFSSVRLVLTGQYYTETTVFRSAI